MNSASRLKISCALVASLMCMVNSLQATEKAKGPLKVFILAGQSNMDGQAATRTIDFLGEDLNAERAALLKVFRPDGTNFVTRDDVWIANCGVYDKLQPGFGGRRNYDKLGERIGPEYSFGYYMGEKYDEQVLLIKFAPGGQSLYVNFRPPSAGGTGRPELDNAKISQEEADKYHGGRADYVVGMQYREMIRYIHDTLANLKNHFPSYDEKAGFEICGMVWFQGYNDMSDERGRKEYGKNMVCLINDIREEFKVPEMKVVVGVMGVNGVKNELGKMKEVRDGQRFVNSVPHFKGSVCAVETAPLLDERVVALQTAGWLNKDRDLKKQPITDEEKEMLKRACSNKGFHYYGSGRFMILVGKEFADSMTRMLND